MNETVLYVTAEAVRIPAHWRLADGTLTPSGQEALARAALLAEERAELVEWPARVAGADAVEVGFAVAWAGRDGGWTVWTSCPAAWLDDLRDGVATMTVGLLALMGEEAYDQARDRFGGDPDVVPLAGPPAGWWLSGVSAVHSQPEIGGSG